MVKLQYINFLHDVHLVLMGYGDSQLLEELEKIANKLLEKEILFQNDLEKLIGKRPFKTNLELSLEEDSTQESKEEIKNENELDGKYSNHNKE